MFEIFIFIMYCRICSSNLAFGNNLHLWYRTFNTHSFNNGWGIAHFVIIHYLRKINNAFRESYTVVIFWVIWILQESISKEHTFSVAGTMKAHTDLKGVLSTRNTYSLLHHCSALGKLHKVLQKWLTFSGITGCLLVIKWRHINGMWPLSLHNAP